MPDDRPPDAARPLFREPPERFVAARDALVAQLRAEGMTEEATAVRSLRRPTAIVWALNQLSQTEPQAVEQLTSAGAELRAAQQATLSSSAGGADRLRTATAARRAAVSALAETAAGLLREAGHGVRTEEISSALETASVDEAAGTSLAEGTLQRLPPPTSGFGDVFGLTAVPDGADEPDPPTGRRSRGTPPEAGERAEAEAAVAQRRRERDASARTARAARQTAERLEVRAQGMRERLAAAEAELAEADARAGGADLEAARAERELATAQERLDDFAGDR